MFTANREPRSFSLWLGVFTPYKKKSAGSVRPIWAGQGCWHELQTKTTCAQGTKIIYRWSIAQEYPPCQDGEILHDKSIVSASHPRIFCIYHRCFLLYTYSQGIYFQKYNQMEVTPMKEVPIWEKSNLTLEEAAAYSGIGINKLRTLTDNEHCQFVLWVGSKRLIKRRKLDEYTEKMFSL